MGYKTILMHCNDKRRLNALITPSVSLAERFQAHLIGLSVVPPIAVVPAGPPDGMPTIVDAHCALYREENPAMRAAFEDATRGRAFVSQWRDDEAGSSSVADRVLQYARTSDLIVAAQADPQWPGTNWLDVADRLAVESGRPVLIVPNGVSFAAVGEKVVVAWNSGREAARAAFDALPILRRAKDVRFVWVKSATDPSEDAAVDDISTALARHGVSCQATEQVLPGVGVGETLLAFAKNAGADLLVMGCYGHARLREFIFGGASRHVLAHMSLPVLMSH
jgi:nucleotide-binding universal stress UspA family protein